jgi:DNA-directed RNA polymerase specialized sigma24 family protein
MDSFLVDKRCISPVDHASLAENQAIVRRVLTEIHSRGISLIKRYYEENSTYEALAKEEGIPVGTVRSRMNRSKEEIRTSLARFFPDHL